MAQRLVVDHDSLESDLKPLLKRYPSARENLEQAERLMAAEKPLLHQTRFPGFGERKVFKGRIVNSDINRGNSSGYRLVWEDVGEHLRVLHMYAHSDRKRESDVVATVKSRLA